MVSARCSHFHGHLIACNNLFSKIGSLNSTESVCWLNFMTKFFFIFQWSDYSDSLDQITKWLRDTERKVKDTEPKPDLSEKKAQLQKVKVNTTCHKVLFKHFVLYNIQLVSFRYK